MTNEESDIPAAFQSSQGFPTVEPETPSIPEPEHPLVPYPYKVEVPQPVEHDFTRPEEPIPPRTREQLERAVPQYVKCVLKDYGLDVEYDRLKITVTARYTRSLGRCGAHGYHKPWIKISAKHYVDRGYSWTRCKETIRHELAHAWQARWLGYTSHGPTFREKARELDVGNLGRYTDDREPKFIGICQSCGGYFYRHRVCRTVRNPSYGCGDCGNNPDDVEGLEERDSIWEITRNSDWHKVMG